MTADRWHVGLIPCTSSKSPTGLTARTLYRGGPFATMMRHAAQRCDRVLIMSAKYGLLDLDDPVAYYDTFLNNLGVPALAALAAKIQRESKLHYLPEGARLLSYLPKAYHQLLTAALPHIKPHIHHPYNNLGFLRMTAVLSNEIKNHGVLPARR